jgi:pyruvate ferredoxin oxidoreductase gamma subunit
MRFEAVGGMGANLAGQILAESLVLGQGLNGANFSSYGAEKKGSPVKAYVRVCEPTVEVRTSSPVEYPDLLAIFHDGMFAIPGLTDGVTADTTVIVNTARDPVRMRGLLELPACTMGVVDALKIAREEKTRINTAMLGAIAKAVDFIDTDILRQTIVDTLKDRYPQLVEPNVRTFDRGYAELALGVFEAEGLPEAKAPTRPMPEIGYANAPMGGVIANPGNTVRRNLGPSRQGYLPLYHRDRCIDCGLCDMTCPDYVFVFEPGQDKKGRPAMVMRGPDYRFCKGCLKCVEICPVEALTQMEDLPELVCATDVPLIGPPEYLASQVREQLGGEEADVETHWRRVG